MKLLAALFALSFSSLCLADDAWIGNGGTPRLMGDHPTIRMVSEVVKISVGSQDTTADCSFVFHNSGPAMDVRIGFPDEDSSREGEPDSKSVFKRFDSWVNGKPIKVAKLIGKDGDVWQVKTIHFPKGATMRVRDRYVVPTGSGIQSDTYILSYAAYLVHTGASWKGTIGSAKFEFKLDSGFPKPTKLYPWAKYSEGAYGKAAASKSDPNININAFLKKNAQTVLWKGPGKPSLRGHTIVYAVENLKPKKKDDLFIAFAPKSYRTPK